MHERINEPVDVIAAFQGARVTPRRMRWNGRVFPIRQVNLVHSAREGTAKVFYFSVSDESHAFKLQFNTDNMEWKLAELYTE